METKNKDSGRGIGSLILGICSNVFCWVPFLGLIFGVVGMILGFSEEPRTGIATGGIVTSIIGTVISGMYTIFWIFVASLFV